MSNPTPSIAFLDQRDQNRFLAVSMNKRALIKKIVAKLAEELETYFRAALFLLIITAFVIVVGGCATQHKGIPNQVTVPLQIDGNRPYIDVAFRRPDGSTRSARFQIRINWFK
ncbi:MAG TPA: hypothetical protein VN516_07765 [Candidatus Baltobacteraceae bacterium]|nr:hypothetical protein [Candidatus Baltobacteraceae bacterium]